MKNKFSEKMPVVASILWAIVILAFYTLGGAITTILKSSDIAAMAINGAFVLASALVAVLFIIKSKSSLRAYGFQLADKNSTKKVFFYFPAILIEVIGLFAGFRTVNFTYIVVAVFFTLSVGFAEEIYFRGIIMKILRVKGITYALIVSSIIFGVTHMGNIAGGASVSLTMLQVIFAFIFGVVFAELFVITKSILPIVLWHFIHDFLGYIEVDSSKLSLQSLILFASLQCVILFVYAIYMWKKATDDKVLV